MTSARMVLGTAGAFFVSRVTFPGKSAFRTLVLLPYILPGILMDAVKAYNAAIKQSGDANDFATREILEKILNDEDRHIDDIEGLQDQIRQMTLPIFLTQQVRE